MAYIYIHTYSDILFEFLSGIYSDILSDMFSAILLGIYFDILSGIPFGIYSDILSAIYSGISSGIYSDIRSDMGTGPQPGVPDLSGQCNMESMTSRNYNHRQDLLGAGFICYRNYPLVN